MEVDNKLCAFFAEVTSLSPSRHYERPACPALPSIFYKPRHLELDDFSAYSPASYRSKLLPAGTPDELPKYFWQVLFTYLNESKMTATPK